MNTAPRLNAYRRTILILLVLAGLLTLVHLARTLSAYIAA